jgi:hypothetical protein
LQGGGGNTETPPACDYLGEAAPYLCGLDRINSTWDFFLEITLSFLNLSNISDRKDFSAK